jgi:outer membrane receptor for ferrienterochelin and colicins
MVLVTLGQHFFANAAASAEGYSSARELLLFEDIPVVTAAARHPQTPREAPAFVTVVTSDEIKKYGHRKFSDILRSLVGFYTSNDRNYGYLGVRGLLRPGDWNSRAVVLVNGHVANDYLYGAFGQECDFILDVDNIERVEIVRCPGATLYRNDALFAVINVVTKEAKDVSGVRVSTAGGSLGLKKGSVSYGLLTPSGVDMLFSVSRTRVDGYKSLYYKEFDLPETNFGFAGHADGEEAENFFARILYGELAFQAARVSRDKYIPTAPYGTEFNDNRTMTQDARSFVELKLDHKLDDSKTIMGRAFYDDMHSDGHYPSYDERIEGVLDWPDSADEEWWGSEVVFSWQTSGWNRMTAGAEFQDHTRGEQKAWSEIDGVYLFENHPFQVWSLYFQDEVALRKNLHAMAGVRHDDYSTWGQTTNPRFALAYDPLEKTTLKLLYGTAFRAPNLYELYFDDGMTTKGNVDLEPEQMASWELVAEQELGRGISGTVSLYNYSIDDLISQTLDPEDEMIVYKNVDHVEAQGVELELRGRWKGGLQGYIGCSFQRARDADTGELLTNSPRTMAKLGAIVPLLRDKLFASAEVQYVDRRLTLGGNYTDDYLLTNINFLCRPLGNDLEVSFGIYNLFNEKYFDPGSAEHVQDQIQQDGRTFLLRLAYTF